MRQQPFFGYVHDLSAEDPTNVFTLFGLVPEWHFQLFWMHLPPHLGLLPLILGCTLLALQLNSPKMADPMQQKMMLINPVIFTFIMAHLPVGLVIYYIWSNSISIGQQRFIRWFYRKRFKKEPARPTLDLPGQKS
jgi:YidC/Oxa1 family membrane protein insertase